MLHLPTAESAEDKAKDITNFIQNEREIVSLYGKNVTWQESLAKLKDVHSVFPSKLLETNEYTA